MSPTNWRDGGGYYPPGSDTPDAPWNRPDAPEPSSNEYAQATEEIWPFLSWDDSATLNDIANAAELLNTTEGYEAVEIAEACDKLHPIASIDDALRETIDKQATDWLCERATEIAAEIDPYEEAYDRECARADDEYDRMREERD